MVMNDLLLRWRNAVDRAAVDLGSLRDDQAGLRPSPERWSIKELIGHLLDSATNNHRRFVEAALGDDLVFPGYDQDRWVMIQRYQEAPWPGLATVWVGLNHQLIHTVGVIPDAILDKPRTRHNLDEIAWRGVPPTGSVTLAYCIEDYVGHLEHHLAQVRAIIG